jgi:prepilin-type processing-associated H-X9-DG protein
VLVFKPPVWNPKVMLCPSDIQPREEHSYLLNDHLARYKIKYGSTRGVSRSDIILMGEKKSDWDDYYMNLGDFPTRVEQYRHGLHLGSNYLFMDGHVDSKLPQWAINAIDPWDPTAAKNPTPQ